MKPNKIIPIFVPHYGCKNECVFCNQKRITGIDSTITPLDVSNEIEKCLLTLNSDKHEIIVAFYGGSFTGIPINKMIELLEVANDYVVKHNFKGIRISTRPDYISADILELLKKYSIEMIELGVQSLDDEVLLATKRGHDSGCVGIACNLIRKFNFKLGIQTMIGLPLQTKQSIFITMEKVIKLSPDCVRIYPVLVVKDTELEQQYANEEFEPIPFDTAVEYASLLTQEYENNNIKVIRVGLQASESLCEKDVIVAGPWAENFNEIVLARKYLQKLMSICEIIVNQNKTTNEIHLFVPDKIVSQYIGNSKCNLLALANKYTGIKVAIHKQSIYEKLKRKIINPNAEFYEIS